MSFVIAHFRKVKTEAGLGKLANHNSRFNIYDETGETRPRPENLPADEPWPPAWISRFDQAHLNAGKEDRGDDSIGQTRSRVIQEAALKRKPQKNAAAAIEAVFSASPDSFENVSDWKAFLGDCREWVNQKFDRQNVIQWDEHYDEKTPHLHVIMTPIIRNPELGNKYSSADFLGGRDGLRAIQTELHEKVGIKYGLERGRKGSKARHTNQVQWAAKLEEKEKELDEKERELGRKEEQVKNVLKVPPEEAAEAINIFGQLKTRTPVDLQNLAGKVANKKCATYGEYVEALKKEYAIKDREKEREIKQQGRGRSR